MRGYRLVTDEYLEAENRARSEAQVISTQPHTESDPGLLPTEVTSDAVPADRHLEQRVETLEEILLMSRPTADAQSSPSEILPSSWAFAQRLCA